MSSGTTSRIRTLGYRVTTLIIAAESMVGGVWDVLRTDYVRDVLEVHLGYPPYVAVLLGVCKIPGALVLLAPGLPRLKEWVYAGVVFVYTGAIVSHLAVGDVTGALGPVGFTALTMVSWALRPSDRRDFAAAPFGSGPANRAAVIGYWATTIIIATVLLTGGAADLMRRPETVAGVVALGYPLYFVSIIGFWKILGALALLAPRFPRLKEWAYAGAFFNFAGAVISHVVAGSAVGHVIWTSVFSACTIVSWAFRPHDRRALAAPVGDHDADRRMGRPAATGQL